MAITLKLASIATAISQISISGVTVKDKDAIAASFLGTPHVLYPRTDGDGWLTDFRIEYQSLMRGASAPANIFYTLHYRYLSVLVGDMAIGPQSYQNLVNETADIIEAIFGTYSPYSGAVTMEVGGVSLGPKVDPAGNQYFGSDFDLLIMEMQN